MIPPIPWLGRLTAPPPPPSFLSSASLSPPPRYCAATAGCRPCAISVAAAALPATATQLPRFPSPPRCHHCRRAVAMLPPPPPLCCHHHHRRASTATALPLLPPLSPSSQLPRFRRRDAATIAAAPPPPLLCCRHHRRFAATSTALPLLPCCHCRHRCLHFCCCRRCRPRRQQVRLCPFLFC